MDTSSSENPHSADEAERLHLKSEFYKVLKQLPVGVHTTLRKYWDGFTDQNPLIINDLVLPRSLGYSVRWACSLGFAFHFHPELVRSAPEVHLHTVIAHEIAHAFIMARDGIFFLSLSNDPIRMSLHEAQTISLTSSWGYDQPAAEAWLRKNVP